MNFVFEKTLATFVLTSKTTRMITQKIITISDRFMHVVQCLECSLHLNNRQNTCIPVIMSIPVVCCLLSSCLPAGIPMLMCISIVPCGMHFMLPRTKYPFRDSHPISICIKIGDCLDNQVYIHFYSIFIWKLSKKEENDEDQRIYNVHHVGLDIHDCTTILEVGSMRSMHNSRMKMVAAEFMRNLLKYMEPSDLWGYTHLWTKTKLTPLVNKGLA